MKKKNQIKDHIQKEIDTSIMVVYNKHINLYMKKMPNEFIIYDEDSQVISREQQREYVLHDWSIIDRTLNNVMVIDSIDYLTTDSLYVYTSKRWERIRIQRDRVTTDTIITN